MIRAIAAIDRRQAARFEVISLRADKPSSTPVQS
jgi:hypothetical protein